MEAAEAGSVTGISDVVFSDWSQCQMVEWGLIIRCRKQQHAVAEAALRVECNMQLYSALPDTWSLLASTRKALGRASTLHVQSHNRSAFYCKWDWDRPHTMPSSSSQADEVKMSQTSHGPCHHTTTPPSTMVSTCLGDLDKKGVLDKKGDPDKKGALDKKGTSDKIGTP